MSLTTEIAAIDSGPRHKDVNTRNALADVKTALTTVGARVCTTIASTVGTTTPVLVAATLDSLINGLRNAGLMN